jgi:hypothetical protein
MCRHPCFRSSAIERVGSCRPPGHLRQAPEWRLEFVRGLRWRDGRYLGRVDGCPRQCTGGRSDQSAAPTTRAGPTRTYRPSPASECERHSMLLWRQLSRGLLRHPGRRWWLVDVPEMHGMRANRCTPGGKPAHPARRRPHRGRSGCERERPLTQLRQLRVRQATTSAIILS